MSKQALRAVDSCWDKAGGASTVIPGQAAGLSPESMNTRRIQFVMLALVASIHALNTSFDQRKRG
jgi:hypothetical protein